jgi:hypothetical protein
MKTEQSYFDKTGKEIKEFAVLKVFHFKGVNEKGRGRKNYYMYKWVRLIEEKGELVWVAVHLSNDKNDYYHLRTVADKGTRHIYDTEIVQQYKNA